MRNFSNLFNSFNTAQSGFPFATAGSSFASSAVTRGLFSPAGRSKITLSGILNGAQKTIGTVNQIVPLYNQVKPMFQNSKVLINVAKGLKNTTKRAPRQFTNQMNNYSQETIDVKPVEVPKESTNKKEGTSPSKPFFI